jgi:hypothetical protein
MGHWAQARPIVQGRELTDHGHDGPLFPQYTYFTDAELADMPGHMSRDDPDDDIVRIESGDHLAYYRLLDRDGMTGRTAAELTDADAGTVEAREAERRLAYEREMAAEQESAELREERIGRAVKMRRDADEKRARTAREGRQAAQQEDRRAEREEREASREREPAKAEERREAAAERREVAAKK